MNQLTTRLLTGVALLSMAALPACSSPDVDVPGAGQGTGSDNAAQPGNEAAPQKPSASVATPAPKGGAAARIGEKETTIAKVSCVDGDTWSMSGAADVGTKVAVTGTKDRSKILSASIVMEDGTVVRVAEGAGEAVISWDGERFTVTGSGELMNLNKPDAKPTTSDFVITAACA